MATKFQCELSWSASRAKEFDLCRRLNWYSRYSSWSWWTEKPRGEKYERMILKNLTSIPAFTGNCVHTAIESWFHRKQGGAAMTAEELFEESRELFRAGWRESSGDGWKSKPNKSTHLEDHHFGGEIPEERLENSRKTMELSTRFFCEAPELAPAREAHPDSWRGVEAMDTYQFLGTKVYAVPDFVYLDGETLHIWDWKTGRPRDADKFQLQTYALYACEKWGTDPETIRMHAAYLALGEVQSQDVNIDELSAVQDQMSESLRAMMDVHYDPDEDECIQANWPATGAPHACGTCRFRDVCSKS